MNHEELSSLMKKLEKSVRADQVSAFLTEMGWESEIVDGDETVWKLAVQFDAHPHPRRVLLLLQKETENLLVASRLLSPQLNGKLFLHGAGVSAEVLRVIISAQSRYVNSSASVKDLGNGVFVVAAGWCEPHLVTSRFKSLVIEVAALATVIDLALEK